MRAATEFFIKAENEVYRMGHGEEIRYFSGIKFEDQSIDTFVNEYIYVILNSGISEKGAHKIHARVVKAMNELRPDWDLEIPRVSWKRYAIRSAVDHGKEWFERVKKADDKISVIRSLPSLGGEALGYHLARNMGIDCVKPDRHMKRLAKRFGYATPLEMCQDIKDDFEKNIRLGVIDYILWRYCEIFGSV